MVEYWECLNLVDSCLDNGGNKAKVVAQLSKYRDNYDITNEEFQWLILRLRNGYTPTIDGKQ